MVVAYLRVSTEKQHIENQRDEIERFAEAKGISIDKWLMETISGKMSERDRKLGVLLKSLKTGDTLIVTEISRLSRMLHEVMSIMGRCLDRKITIYSTKDGYAFDDSINSKVLSFAFGLVAEIERNLISQRTREALALRRSQGVTLGRKSGVCPRLDELKASKSEVVRRIRIGQSEARICREMGFSKTTFLKLKSADKSIVCLLEERSSRRAQRRIAKVEATK